MLYTLVSSARLASPSSSSQSSSPSLYVCPGERHRCGCPFGGRAICVGKSQLPKHTLWVFFVTLAAFPRAQPVLAWQWQCGRCFLCSSALQRTISLKSAQISYFVLTVPSYPDQVPVTPITHQTGVCLHTTLLLHCAREIWQLSDTFWNLKLRGKINCHCHVAWTRNYELPESNFHNFGGNINKIYTKFLSAIIN